MPSPEDLYSAPADAVDYELVKVFMLSAEEADLFSESLTFEAKEKRSGSNVAEAVAALSNTDGGVILVGVKDKDATGEARLVGVPKSEHDALASSLHALIPEAMPEIIPVAMPGGQKLILVLRVDADAVSHPVMVSGKVLFRIPGHSVPADRRRVLDLVARDQAAPGTAPSASQPTFAEVSYTPGRYQLPEPSPAAALPGGSARLTRRRRPTNNSAHLNTMVYQLQGVYEGLTRGRETVGSATRDT
jgi:hypothetical protein